MASNRGVVFLGPNHVEVQSIDYPKLENPAGKKINHGVILKVVSTNICGSDQHMVRGAPPRPPAWSSPRNYRRSRRARLRRRVHQEG